MVHTPLCGILSIGVFTMKRDWFIHKSYSFHNQSFITSLLSPQKLQFKSTLLQMLPSTLFGVVEHFCQLYSSASLGGTLVPLKLSEVLLEIIHLLLHLHHLRTYLTQVFLGLTESCFKYFSNLTYGFHGSFTNSMKEGCSWYT